MELSGADVATMERYKQALRDTAKAMNDMRPPAAAATEGNNRPSLLEVLQRMLYCSPLYMVLLQV